MVRKLRPYFLSFCVLALATFAGGFAGPAPSAAAAVPGAEDDISNGLKTFTSVFRLVEENYADKVNADKAIFKGAIPGMLRTLDPHSSFFDPKDFAALKEDQRGHYYGVGMQVSANKDGKVVVVAPFTGSPAYKAGLRPGDIIMIVNDKNCSGLNTAEVADLLKGPKGTPVQVVVAREGVDKPLTFNIIRGEIPRHSVPTAFWLKPGIAYIDIESFTETTSKELEDHLKQLGEDQIKALVLDLRDNPGGLLNEGVAVAGHFLKRDQVVVSHRGRSSPEKNYRATNGSARRDYPIVVMVNRFSASAAEIVAGALQDHDRAWVFGDNTFGKGLVQTVYPMSENTGLALTTAKYYTPSGRLIQRDYSSGSFYDYYFRKDIETKNMLDAKMTDSGRTVYGGAGISPDEKFTLKTTRFQADTYRRRAYFDFASKYFGSHDPKAIAKNWEPDEGILSEFHDFLLKNNFQFSEAEFTESRDFMRTQLKREVFTTVFNLDEALQFAVQSDPAVQKALESVSKAKELLETSAKKQQIVLNERRARSGRN